MKQKYVHGSTKKKPTAINIENTVIGFSLQNILATSILIFRTKYCLLFFRFDVLWTRFSQNCKLKPVGCHFHPRDVIALICVQIVMLTISLSDKSHTFI